MAVSNHHQSGRVYELHDDINTTTLASLLANPLLLNYTIDLLPISAVFNLAATSNELRSLVLDTPNSLRRLDLSYVKAAQSNIRHTEWTDLQLRGTVTEDDVYAKPLRGIIFSALRRRDLLHDVTTLILDGLSVTAELVHDIISDRSLSVRILSLREVKNLNHAKLHAVLRMAVRPSRPDGTPHLKGLYIFGHKDTRSLKATSAVETGPSGHHATVSCAWYDKKGRTISGSAAAASEWGETMHACAGIVTFDAPLCRGPRHLNSPAFGSVDINAHSPPPPYKSPKWSVATVVVDACAGCGSAPEGWTVWGESGGIDASDDTCRFPLLSPVPLHSSSVKVARCPDGADVQTSRINRANGKASRRFIARCMDCLHGRICWACSKWWCETCYSLGQVDHVDGKYRKCRILRSCWECNNNCLQCIEKTQKTCGSCCGGYCTIHNTGCNISKNTCDWCSTRRRTRDLYY